MFSSSQALRSSSKLTPTTLNEQIVYYLNREASLKGWLFSTNQTPKQNTQALSLSIESSMDEIKPIKINIYAEKKHTALDTEYREQERNPFPQLPKKLPSGGEFALYTNLLLTQPSSSTSFRLDLKPLNQALKKTVLLLFKLENSPSPLSYLLRADLCLPNSQENEAAIQKYIKVYNAVSAISKSFSALENPNFSCHAFSAIYKKAPSLSTSQSGNTYRAIYKLMLKTIHRDIKIVLDKLKSTNRGLETPKTILLFLKGQTYSSANIENDIIHYLDDLFFRATEFLSALDLALSVQTLKKQSRSLSAEDKQAPKIHPTDCLKQKCALLEKNNTALKNKVHALEEQNKLLQQQNTALKSNPAGQAPPSNFTEEEHQALKTLASQLLFAYSTGTPAKASDLANLSLLSLFSTPASKGAPQTPNGLNESTFSLSTTNSKRNK